MFYFLIGFRIWILIYIKFLFGILIPILFLSHSRIGVLSYYISDSDSHWDSNSIFDLNSDSHLASVYTLNSDPNSFLIHILSSSQTLFLMIHFWNRLLIDLASNRVSYFVSVLYSDRLSDSDLISNSVSNLNFDTNPVCDWDSDSLSGSVSN